MKSKSKKLNYFETPIIAGSLKGKKILIPDLLTTRSTKSIIRESLFNTLQFDIVDKLFIEVFAGSGSVGIEAVSRGAKNVYFLEKNKKAYNALRDNIQRLSINNAITMHTDSFDSFDNLHAQLQDKDIKTYFYFDPPFDIRDGMEDVYEKTIELIASVDASICEMVIIEHISILELPKTIGAISMLKQKRFGKSTLSYYQPNQDD